MAYDKGPLGSPDQFNACPGRSVFQAMGEALDKEAAEDEQRRIRDFNMQAPEAWSESDWREREIGYRAISRATEILAGGEIHPGDLLLPEK